MKIEEYLNNLPPKVRELVLNGDIEERINFIKKPKFIMHNKAKKIFEKLDELFYAPKKDRIRSMLLVGESNIGKTEMIKKYKQQKQKLIDTPEMIDFENPVLYVQAPNSAKLNELYDSIFMEFVVPFRKYESYIEREAKIKYYCERFEIKMIIIDEIQGALIGSITKQKEFMNGIKNLSNKLQIPIVLVGTPKGISLITNDHQLKSRFVPTKIKKWEWDEDYISLLYAIELSLPLKKPSLIYKDQKLAKKILELSDGLIGDIITICNLMAEYAIKTGEEKIKREFLNKINYVPVYDQKGIIYADEI